MTIPVWRLLRTGDMSGAMNMALDEALLESVAAGQSAPILRLYGWAPPTVSLGYFQRGNKVVNLGACREYGYDVVRRSTGGRAVLHDQEVTYSVIAPNHDEVFSGGISDNYHIIAQGLLALVRSFGIEAEIAGGRQKVPQGGNAAHNVCFFSPAFSELVYAGCKLVGSAQRRLGNAFLQHGSIPLNIDPEILFRVLTTSEEVSPAEGGAMLAARVGWLNRWLTTPVSRSEVEERLILHLGNTLNVTWQESQPTGVEWQRAEECCRNKFATAEWTFGAEKSASGERF